MLFRVEIVDIRLKIFNFVFVFKAERKALAGARVMVAVPKIGSKKARSEKSEDEIQNAGAGLNEIFRHPSRIPMQKEAKSIAEEDGKCTRFSSLEPVEKKT